MKAQFAHNPKDANAQVDLHSLPLKGYTATEKNPTKESSAQCNLDALPLKGYTEPTQDPSKESEPAKPTFSQKVKAMINKLRPTLQKAQDQAKKTANFVFQQIRAFDRFLYKAVIFTAAICIIYSFIQANNPELALQISEVANSCWNTIVKICQDCFASFNETFATLFPF